MTAHQRSLVKTALVLGIIAIILAIGTVWPSILGYLVLIGFTAFIVTAIYGMFRMVEDQKEWEKHK